MRYLPERQAYILSRLYFLIFPILFYYFSRLFSTLSGNAVWKAATKQLPEGYPVDPNFTPRYNPFGQHVCFAPDGDFYDAVRKGAKIVTRTVKRVVGDGILLDDGSKLHADIIITATGLKMRWGGKIRITVDGKPYRIGDKLAWHNAMLQDLPNAMVVTGYIMASWTLGTNATAFLLCRLLRGMRKHGLSTIFSRVPADGSVKPCPLLTLSSTYVLAAAPDSLPKSSNNGP
jgi:cation diffusion facilitator CzcD-associated flavoprotein CzcO